MRKKRNKRTEQNKASIVERAKEVLRKIKMLKELVLVSDDRKGALYEMKRGSAAKLLLCEKLLEEGINLFEATLPPRNETCAQSLYEDISQTLAEINKVAFDCGRYNVLIEKRLYPLAQLFSKQVEKNAIV